METSRQSDERIPSGSAGTRKKQCFISHCSDDGTMIDALCVVLREAFDSSAYDFFCTAQEEHSTLAGAKRGEAIREALSASDFMIAVITDSFIRSTICISEVSAFWYADKPIVPIVYSKDGVEFLKELLGEDVIYIDMISPSTARISKSAQKMAAAFLEYDMIPWDEKALRKALVNRFFRLTPVPPTRCFIGSKGTYENINRYCDTYGVRQIKNTSLSASTIRQKLKKCRDIYIVGSTSANLINALTSEFIPSALMRGTRFTVLIANQHSDFVDELAELEEPESVEGNIARFAREFDGVVYNLKSCLQRKEVKAAENAGEIYLGCAYTLIRQTFLLGIDDDRNIWCWLSLTLPPKRTIDGTPSFELYGKMGDGSVAELVYGHMLSIRQFAEKRQMLVALSRHPDFENFFLENSSAERYWRSLYQEAMMRTQSVDNDCELIEVAAQHPLQPSGQPGREFAARLDKAVALYSQLTAEGKSVSIYVPGSVHCFKGKADVCSLSKAGTDYLLEKGIPAENLLGETENTRYKGEKGVYNSADECYVASRIFFDHAFGRLHCVCSPNQMMRKKLFYIAFGVIPFFHTVNSLHPAHDDMYEIFHSIPDVLFRDHTWQGEDSEKGNASRRERDPALVFRKGSVTEE